MIKTLKQLIHVLWAIEKDLRVIASNTGVNSKAEINSKDIISTMRSAIHDSNAVN
ncbi:MULTISPECIES: hypothetical protein [Lentilactobacillus]|uniref:Uncharacterized protein n=2 Tax=Lentilactobacillus TaxID=2767893 RepID=S4PR06_9LACO|nr:MULTISPECIES: hypothetical protein [Lentilactobacillus]KRK90158.1 hypothetical protein FD17_GL000404 [Lentilactobacillus sunkii DSM 19904]ORN08107.1 hypothetical protein FAM21834_01868 [Lentilactobacillus parabuchneri]GAD17670.1 hypothetical protein LOT_2208 [Lentilactobacillus otakiensis DSM 19908 = JCM 15040]